MNVIDTAAVTEMKLGYERSKSRVHEWGKASLYALLMCSILTVVYFYTRLKVFGGTGVVWGGLHALMVLSAIWVGVSVFLTINFVVDQWLYKLALTRADKPFEHSLFIPRDVAETKAGVQDIKTWEERVLTWAEENVGKSAMRKNGLGYRFFFKEFEDYALFKLWV